MVFVFCQTNILAAWDGHISTLSEGNDNDIDKETPQTITLVDMNKLSLISDTVASPSKRITRSANYTARWDNHLGSGDLYFRNIPRDWSEVEYLELPIYSEKVTDAGITIIIYCEPEPDYPGSTYLYSDIYIDWVGWKTFKINIDERFTQRNNANRSKVTYMRFSVTGWNGEAHEDTDIYFDSIKGHLFDHNKEEREQKALEEAMEGGIAVYNNCMNMLKDNRVSLIDLSRTDAVATISKGVSMLPLSFYKDHLGADVDEVEEGFQLNLEGKTLLIKPNEKKYISNGEELEFNVAPFYRNNLLFLPIEDSIIALNKHAKSFGDLTIIGSEANISSFEDNETLISTCISTVANFVPDASMVDASDFAQIRENWKIELVGHEINDLSDPDIKRIIQNVESRGENSWKRMNYGSDRDKYFALFGTERITTTADMGTQYNNVNYMAKAYGMHGSKLYKNEELKEDILDGLEWLYNNVYGQAELEGRGWRSTADFNWLHWYRTVPNNLVDIYMIMGEEIGKPKILEYLSLFEHLMTWMRASNSLGHSNSRRYGPLGLAVIKEDTELMKARMEDLGRALIPEEIGDGFKDDYLYLYHRMFPYTSGYGINGILGTSTQVMNILKGTKYTYTSEHKNNLIKYMYNSFIPIFYNGRAMIMFGGRNISEVDDAYSGLVIIRGILNIMGMFGVDDDLYLKQLLRFHINEEDTESTSYIFRMLTIDQIKLLREILDDDTIPPLEDYTDCRVYWSGDRVVQQRNGYSVGVAMSSRRVANYESINEENASGWYTGDGALYVYNNGPKQYHLDYYKNVNWARYPGTTEDTQVREPYQIALSQTYMPNPSFVGGVQYNSDFATVAMDFEAFNNLVESDFVTKGYGLGLPIHESTLVAKKAWFLFDDEIVALGAGINANEGYFVNTYLNNRMLYKEEEINGQMVYGTEDINIDGEVLEKSNSYTMSFKNPGWVYVETEGGYYFPRGGNLVVNKTDANPSFLEMWLEHGVNPENGSYAYVILPDKTPEEIAEYSRTSDIQIIQNTSRLQVVKENSLGITGIILWEAGSYDDITVSDPLVLMISEQNGEYIIKISDPTHNLMNANVTIRKPLELIECDDVITVDKSGSVTNINLDLTDVKGQTLTAKFKTR
jgi:hyaluronate lyase